MISNMNKFEMQQVISPGGVITWSVLHGGVIMCAVLHGGWDMDFSKWRPWANMEVSGWYHM